MQMSIFIRNERCKKRGNLSAAVVKEQIRCSNEIVIPSASATPLFVTRELLNELGEKIVQTEGYYIYLRILRAFEFSSWANFRV